MFHLQGNGWNILSNVIAQRQALTCESDIEKEYYKCAGRGLDCVDICIHCGEKGGCDFILGQKQLEERNKTAGKKCYPICVHCLDSGKKIVTYLKAKTNQSQKRKEEASAKIAERAAAASKKAKTNK